MENFILIRLKATLFKVSLKYLKYLRNFEKRSKLTKSLDFFVRGERDTLSDQFEERHTLIEPTFQ